MLPTVTVVIKGLDNCLIENEKKVVINKYNQFIKDIKIKQYKRETVNNIDTELVSELQIIFYPMEFDKKSYAEIQEIAKNIAKLLIRELITKGYDISRCTIESPSICKMVNGKITAYNEITLKEINDGSIKQKFDEDTLVIENAGNKFPLVDVLEESNEVQRFESLYETLKNNCGNSQIQVTKIIQQKFADKYDIYCMNKNINPEYVKKHPAAENQDDFTYLRTMISHGNPNYFEEIEERLPREIRKIVKVISDLESESLG